MVSGRTIAGLATLALSGYALGQQPEEHSGVPTTEELLQDLLTIEWESPQLVREMQMLLSLDRQVRNNRAVVVRLRRSLLGSISSQMVFSYRSIRRVDDDPPPSMTKILLLLSMPCTASEEGLERLVRNGTLTEKELCDLADKLLGPANILEGAVLGHLYKLHAGETDVRIRHAMMLAQFEPATEVVPHLVEELTDEDQRVVQETITALGTIGPAAKAAIPALEKLIESEDNQVSTRAKAALRQIREESKR